VTYYYNIGWIEVPSELKHKIEYLMAKRGVSRYFEIFDVKDHSILEFEGGELAASSIVMVDEFLKDLAKLLKDTRFDYQQVPYEYSEGNGHFFFFDGKLADIKEKVITREVEGAKLGERYKIVLEMEVIGVAPNKVVVVG